ncbi:uncharacterized protein LOC132736671 [Ruditapes philippinarum]|uniref:uncharacterized protein LOC132736671 n=1 Tax=Ruditapes philippinarum TaxID=129788 RepID=UPI00295C3380|nr:uncharacterized protein LOC132736671 [Ruditapes philippinarum]
MDDSRKLYRLLREDENPMIDGIRAKLPQAQDTPLKHIRNGSCRKSQWISTSRSLSCIEKFIKLKRKREGSFTVCRVVIIDEQKLMLYSEYFRLRNIFRSITEYRKAPIDTLIKPLIDEQTIGEILDFTDPKIMDKYIPSNPSRPMINDRARGYARKYDEVLVERFIPASCCLDILYK